MRGRKRDIGATEYLGLGYFIHPLPMAAVILLGLNDHYFKARWPSFLTGKISDFAGLFFFPIFLCALYNLTLTVVAMVSPTISRSPLVGAQEVKHVRWITAAQLVGAMLATDLVFTAIKVSPTATALFERLMGDLGFPSRATLDATDLVAISMNVATWLYVKSQIGQSPVQMNITSELTVIEAGEDSVGLNRLLSNG